MQMRLFIHVFRILFTIIHSNTYLEKGHNEKEAPRPCGAVVMMERAKAIADGMEVLLIGLQGLWG